MGLIHYLKMLLQTYILIIKCEYFVVVQTYTSTSVQKKPKTLLKIHWLNRMLKVTNGTAMINLAFWAQLLPISCQHWGLYIFPPGDATSLIMAQGPKQGQVPRRKRHLVANICTRYFSGSLQEVWHLKPIIAQGFGFIKYLSINLHTLEMCANMMHVSVKVEHKHTCYTWRKSLWHKFKVSRLI